ncbi:MAG: hypothetical protein A2X94_13845 [Bdellovibrionales bacterium GWB1_55_8]|nr:MAG: hypothetical protein A2X94_13845 [Bdellovibrionales bacterium GWB1_55_8]
MKMSDTETATKTKWTENLWTFIVAAAIAGPFALPLLWRNPRLGRTAKISWTVVVLALTAFLLLGTGELFRNTLEQLEALRAAQ